MEAKGHHPQTLVPATVKVREGDPEQSLCSSGSDWNKLPWLLPLATHFPGLPLANHVSGGHCNSEILGAMASFWGRAMNKTGKLRPTESKRPVRGHGAESEA